jgi:hypothetical protein
MELEERAKKGSVAVAECEPPGPRVSASFVPYVTPVSGGPAQLAAGWLE